MGKDLINMQFLMGLLFYLTVFDLLHLLMILLICLAVFVLLYLLMIMPRMLGRPDTTPFLKWLYAHRGLHDNGSDAPENSMRAFQKAVDAGFGIEMDVQLTKDGVPVVFHDYTLKRMCGAEGKVEEYTFEELQQLSLCGTDQKIPKFEDVLRLVDGRVPLIVELKIESTNTSVCSAADKLLTDYKGMYCIESFNPLGVLWYRRKRRQVVRGQLADAFHREGEYSGPLYFLLENLLFNWLGKPDFIAYNRKYPGMLSRRLCRGLYRSTAAAWTIKSQKELDEAAKHFDIFIFDSFIPQR